jgi:4a-hydroxytetrahydrobiopterin dehydratase
MKLKSAINAGWLEEENAISRNFDFKDFKEALAFVQKVGKLAEKIQHHPDIFLHDYKHVTLRLTTHDTGGVSDKDIDLAREIDAL